MINARIKTLLKQKSWKIKDLSIATGIEASQLSRMLGEHRRWHIEHLEKVAKALGVQVGDLADAQVALPIKGEISARENCRFPGDKDKVIGYAPLPRMMIENGGCRMAGEFYGLQVKDDSFEPILLDGAQLIIQKEGSIKDRDIVVYCDESQRMWAGRIGMPGDMVLLRSLNPTHQKDKILPISHLKLMDRVVGMLFI